MLAATGKSFLLLFFKQEDLPFFCSQRISGNSQAVRLPKDFRVAGQELEIFRRGDEIILREKRPGLLRALDILADSPDAARRGRDASAWTVRQIGSSTSANQH